MINQSPVCECGSDEFITNLNAYDVYEVIDGKLSFVKQEHIEEKDLLYCRACGKEYTEPVLENK
jgi:hypothetical protein